MKKLKKIVRVLLVILAVGYFIFNGNLIEKSKGESDGIYGLNVYFLDVGQADAILIDSNGKYVLIDAGNNNDGEKLVNYFNSLNIKEFEYVIATHPHEDHIGGMDIIVNNFQIKKFYMPNVITTTSTFESLLNSLENQNISFEVPKIGSTFIVDESTFEILSLGDEEENLNDSSIILKMTYKDVSFLFMGDASSEVEKKILNKNLSAEVLKVGHHGSSSSTSTNFLKYVNPSYAIISVGKDNSYNHPNEKTLQRLEENNIKIYRTDEVGTIKASTDGVDIIINTLNTDTNG